jgi:hypothetical protein
VQDNKSLRSTIRPTCIRSYLLYLQYNSSKQWKAAPVITFLWHSVVLKGTTTKGDEHPHHPVCEACGKEFSNTHELSVHIDEAHRK